MQQEAGCQNWNFHRQWTFSRLVKMSTTKQTFVLRLLGFLVSFSNSFLVMHKFRGKGIQKDSTEDGTWRSPWQLRRCQLLNHEELDLLLQQ
jgi:hypothetical protein